MKKITTLLTVILFTLIARAQIQEPVHWSEEILGDSVRITAAIDSGWHMTLLEMNGVEIDDETEYSEYSTVVAINDTLRYNACNDMMCTAPMVWFYKGNAPEETAPVSTAMADIPQQSLWWIFLMGLLGGLLAIFTPCVWPIIPMTVSFFLKRAGADNKGGGLRDAIVYGLSIIIIYVGLGLLITVLFGASALNAMSTNLWVNLVFFLILIVFAMSFFGLFEITLPSSWSTGIDTKARTTGGLVSIMLMAFTLVIVSFSCTGPIIGTLLVEAAGKSLLAPTIGMLGFAVALALPFTLFALFPGWMQRMPRSGGWMTSFKVSLAFLELALSLKFLSVADMAYFGKAVILPRWAFLALWILIFAAWGIYMIWGIPALWKNTAKGKPIFRTCMRVLIALATIAFSIYLLPGLKGAPVKAVSAFAPPMPIEGREVFDNYEEGLAFARQENKPILLDFSGVGCVNCRKMEAYVLDDEHVKERLQNYVLIELMVDVKGGVGDRNSKLQAERFGSNAQPYYIQLDAAGEPISEPYAFSTQVEDFLNWLKY